VGIIATSYKNRNQRRQQLLKIRCYSHKNNSRGDIGYLFFTYGLSEYTRGPLGRRARTLQEEILAPRIL
jgi:hypothetical protein